MALGLQFISKVRNYQIYADLNVRHSQVSSYRFASSKSASSSRYLARQKRDPYVRARESSGNDKGVKYVSRSAFKLEQLNEAYKFLGPSKNVVDLGAAPGGWSQVALKLGCNRVFALDLLPLHESVLQHQNNRLTFIQGDFRSNEIQKQLKDIIIQDRGENGKIDVIMSDMMANTSGNPIRDSVASIDLLHSALDFAKATLTSFNGGGQPEKSPSVLIMKYFEGNDAQEFKRDYLQPSFTRIVSKKAAASRSESSEMYFICFGLKTQTQIVTNKIQ